MIVVVIISFRLSLSFLKATFVRGTAPLFRPQTPYDFWWVHALLEFDTEMYTQRSDNKTLKLNLCIPKMFSFDFYISQLFMCLSHPVSISGGSCRKITTPVMERGGGGGEVENVTALRTMEVTMDGV